MNGREMQIPQGQPVSEEFQRVALAFDILRSVPAAEDDRDGTVTLRKTCSEHITTFLQASLADSRLWKPAAVAK